MVDVPRRRKARAHSRRDVMGMLAGTAVRGAVEMIRQAGGEVVRVVLVALDSEQIGHEGKSGAGVKGGSRRSYVCAT